MSCFIDVSKGPSTKTLSLSGESPDEEIVGQVLAGNRDLFRHLVDRHSSKVFGMIMRQVGNRDVASDLSQDTFLLAFQKLRSFRQHAQFSTWLIRIALNTTSNYFQSKQYRQSLANRTIDPSYNEASTPEIDDLRAKEHSLIKLREGIAKLKPKFRDVIVLCSLEGKSYDEAATILSIPVGTVRSRLNTARLELRRHFEDEVEK